MLLGFRVANVLSFRDEQHLSLVATDMNDGSARPTGIREHSREISVVPVVGIYGANASGKTNVLTALNHMRTTVLESVRWFSEPDPVRRIAFALDPGSREKPSFYEVEIVLSDGVRYTYGFEIDDRRVHGEWLHAYPKGRKQVWFDRKGEEIGFPGEGLRGDKLELARRTRGDALFLSVAAQLNHEQLAPVFQWFRDGLWPISPEYTSPHESVVTRRVLEDGKFRERMARMLHIADLGITGFDETALAQNEIRMRHRTRTHDMSLDFAAESLGTRSWFYLIGTLLAAFDAGATVIVDELDSSLHSAMSAEVVQLFGDPGANPRDAQLIFTTHDVALLHTLIGDDRVLDRDTVWLTEKGVDGATELYPLTDLRPPPRKEDNLFRKYLLGKYGGVPRVSSGAVAREVEEVVR